MSSGLRRIRSQQAHILGCESSQVNARRGSFDFCNRAEPSGLRRPVLESKERQNREAEKYAHADANAQVAHMVRLEHCEPQHDQQSAKRRNEPQNASLVKHASTLTQSLALAPPRRGEPQARPARDLSRAYARDQ